jgi:hypothetical protein
LLSEDTDEQKAFLTLESILAEAVDSGADSIGLEYVDEGLEVTYMFGDSGFGNVVIDRMLEGKVIDLIVERAKLENKSRGVIDWTHRGKLHRITVVEYESFGEVAFKLLLRKRRRRHH